MAAAGTPEQKTMEKALQKENKMLRGEIKNMHSKIRAISGDLTKSNAMKDRLEGLCRELQKQNRFIKAESSAKIREANEKGRELATEVHNNMGFMKNINENLASISSESQKVRKENEELAKKVTILQDYYDQREKILTDALKESKDGMSQANAELTEFQLKNAQEKEKLIKEMQQLAVALDKSREEIKIAKETETGLRSLIENYDGKFNGLQKALQDTNAAYNDFKSEMEKVTQRTRELEKDAVKWQQRWEESNTALNLMTGSYEKIRVEVGKSHESLSTMTNLCRALQTERKDLLAKLNKSDGGGPGADDTIPDVVMDGPPSPAKETAAVPSELRTEAASTAVDTPVVVATIPPEAPVVAALEVATVVTPAPVATPDATPAPAPVAVVAPAPVVTPDPIVTPAPVVTPAATPAPAAPTATPTFGIATDKLEPPESPIKAPKSPKAAKKSPKSPKKSKK